MPVLDKKEKYECPKCKQPKTLAEFGMRHNRYRQSYCQECRNSKPSQWKGFTEIPCQQAAMKALYGKHYPNDTAPRSWKFMAQKVSKKLTREGKSWHCNSTL